MLLKSMAAFVIVGYKEVKIGNSGEGGGCLQVEVGEAPNSSLHSPPLRRELLSHAMASR
jgi:hypothetical protein